MRNLITYEEISQLARPCTADEDLAAAMIAEAQRVEIKPRIGDDLYIKLIDSVSSSTPGISRIFYGGTAAYTPSATIKGAASAATIIKGVSVAAADPRFNTLMQGGRWTTKDGRTRLLTGLKTALAYYALARIVRDGNIQTTTYGAVVKDDQYSAEAEKSERQRQYRELFEQADSYMAEVISYLTCNTKTFPEYRVAGKMRSNRMTIRLIGK